MSHLLISILILAVSGNEKKDEPILEWTLRYMERDIPKGAEEDLKGASDYKKHRKDFKEISSITISTNGFRKSLVKVAGKGGVIVFGIIPREDNEIKLYASYYLPESKLGGKTTVTVITIDEIKYGEELVIGRSASAVEDRNKPGQLFNGKAKVFTLTVKKTRKTISELAEESMHDASFRKRKGVGTRKEKRGRD